jgi:EamA domain-containing membrane protein RarD
MLEPHGLAQRLGYGFLDVTQLHYSKICHNSLNQMIPIISILFGLMMAGIDIGMMSVSKLTHLGKLPYVGGLALSTAIYALQPFLFLKALSFESMVAVNLVWNLTSSLMVTLIGIFFFKESVKGLRLLAVLIGLCSLILFAFTNE